MSDIHFLTETKRTVIGQAHISPIQETAKPTSPPPHVWVFQRPFHYEISFFCPTFTKKTIRAKTTIYSHPFKIHPWKRTCPLKRDYFSREYIFQPLIFRGHVSFQGSMPIFASHGLRPTRQKNASWQVTLAINRSIKCTLLAHFKAVRACSASTKWGHVMGT